MAEKTGEMVVRITRDLVIVEQPTKQVSSRRSKSLRAFGAYMQGQGSPFLQPMSDGNLRLAVV